MSKEIGHLPRASQFPLGGRITTSQEGKLRRRPVLLALRGLLLVHVSKLRVQVAHFRLLVLREADVGSRLVPPPILDVD